jgi:hypothetical protein
VSFEIIARRWLAFSLPDRAGPAAFGPGLFQIRWYSLDIWPEYFGYWLLLKLLASPWRANVTRACYDMIHALGIILRAH